VASGHCLRYGHLLQFYYNPKTSRIILYAIPFHVLSKFSFDYKVCNRLMVRTELCSQMSHLLRMKHATKNSVALPCRRQPLEGTREEDPKVAYMVTSSQESICGLVYACQVSLSCSHLLSSQYFHFLLLLINLITYTNPNNTGTSIKGPTVAERA